MAEYISKDEIIEAHYNACKKDSNKCFEVWSLQIMLDMPTIDIVHCEECKYYTDGFCMAMGVEKDSDFFCKFGERENTPPIVTDEITELNEENSRLFKENEELKAKLYEISRIVKEETK